MSDNVKGMTTVADCVPPSWLLCNKSNTNGFKPLAESFVLQVSNQSSFLSFIVTCNALFYNEMMFDGQIILPWLHRLERTQSDDCSSWFLA